MKFLSYLRKRKIEDILMFPGIFTGQSSDFFKRTKEYDIYFFFPFYHTGGAEKVHLQIAKIFGKTHKCIIFFTRTSTDERFLQEFKDTGCDIHDISFYTDHKIRYHQNIMWRGRISNLINTQVKRPVVFNGQCNFGYKISPWIKKDILQVELIHSFNTFSWIRIPFLPFITKTVMISRLRIEQHLEQYKKLDIPADYSNRIHYIQNAIELPSSPCTEKQFPPLKALFVGRGTSEKRPELFIAIAKNIPSVTFTLVGEMPGSLLNDLPVNIKAVGNIDANYQLHTIYCEHHILIIPSSTEGFPIVLMEAMARGCIVMATPVGDIPYHINGSNGYLFSSIEEDKIIEEAVSWINELTPEKIKALSSAAKDYAFKNFSIETFNQQYQAILQL